ncbi:MAG: tetratricopeptide repeat protein [Bacteroidales bacterium]|nr:tetratricopeptide repeat protein [Bacteroidales bacterium]
MIVNILTTALAIVLSASEPQLGPDSFEYGLSLYEKGMYSRARTVFEGLEKDSQTEGYAVLCAICMQAEGYQVLLDNYVTKYPWSGLLPKLYWRHGLNLFDQGAYEAASEAFLVVSVDDVKEDEMAEFLFKTAYADFGREDYDAALYGFSLVDAMPLNDYSAPARYETGYINYARKHFSEALPWFEKAAQDPRFADISNYYIMECRFLEGDYDYVIDHGAEMFGRIPEDRQQHLARIISEAYLVKGDPAKAKEYFDAMGENTDGDRADYFYAGSLLYAVGDWEGAIENFVKMEDRSDSLGQAANYDLAYCYIKTRDKVSALSAFTDAAKVSFNPEITEDAFFNKAKLAFDLNGDGSVFNDYLAQYSDLKRGPQVYSYMALAALHNHDYAAAVAAYDNIEELDPDMRTNYMKANYLRAGQLIHNGSWRSAVPCLKAAAYYSDKHSAFNQLSRYWLAESYYRDDQYPQARAIFTDLHNISALDGRPEGSYIPYNIAYCYLRENNYEMAAKWFDEYLRGGDTAFTTDAQLRKADSYFARKNYPTAITAYRQAIPDCSADVDLYPWYQCGLAYGLTGNNDRKIEMLSAVSKANQETLFYEETLYELGKSYIDSGQSSMAAITFEKLVRGAKDSSYVARGLIGLGTVAKNASEYDKALDYYKKVVSSMPNSTWSSDALLAIEQIYQTRQEPEKYLEYVEGLGSASHATDADKEEMLFNSAEQIYLAENWQKALISLQSYAQRYPAGKYLQNCRFYMAECCRNLDRKDQACDLYRKVMDAGEGSFVEIASATYARLSYGMERYADAFAGYENLHRVARIESNRSVALKGMMRSAYHAKDYANALKYADLVAALKDIAAPEAREASYIKAKSLLAGSNRADAMKIIVSLAADKTDAYGAEAAYLEILDLYDRGRFAESQTKVYDFSESGSSQNYWLAKSFLVLGDCFVETGDVRQARATFESIRDGYTPASKDDDIPDAVALRLRKLDEFSQDAI